MSFTEKRLCNPTQLTTSGQTLYTVPAGKTAIIKQLVVTNVTGSAATFSLYIGSATAANALFSATSVAANDAIVINLSQVLNSTEILTALASANSTLNITISGVENDGPLNPLAAYIADSSITTSKVSNNSITQLKLDQNIPLSGMRNKIINGAFDVWQRGSGPIFNFSGYGYGPDRWRAYAYTSNGTAISRGAFSLGNAITGEEPQFFIRVQSTNTAMLLSQPIESVRTFAGQQVTVSFWAKTAAGSSSTPLTIRLDQYFGTGGSPSATVQNTVNNVTLSTSWVRYQTTITLPSISGKTLGTNNDHYLDLVFYSATVATIFDFWGVQVEMGTQATPFEQRPFGTELALCQRYYEKSFAQSQAPLDNPSNKTGHLQTQIVSGSASYLMFPRVGFAVAKRISPSLTFYNPGSGTSGQAANVNNLTTGYPVTTAQGSIGQSLNESGFVVSINNSSLSGVDVGVHWTASAEY